MLGKGFRLSVAVLLVFAGCCCAALAVNSPPVTSVVSPPGMIQVGQWTTVTCTYTDADGVANLAFCSLLINSSVSNDGAAHFFYSQNTNRLFVKDNSGTWVPPTGITRGTAVTIENENAVLDCAGTKVTQTANGLTVTWRIKVKATMARKSCKYYTKATDDSGGVADWAAKGAVYIDSPPTPASVSPASGLVPLDTWTTYTCVYSDADGASNLWLCSLLVNGGISNQGGAHFFYSQNTNRLFMKNNAGTWVPADGVVRGTATTLQSENAVLDCAATTVITSGSTITINWRVKFKSTMVGKRCNLYMKAADDNNAESGWIARGTASMNTTPAVGSASPSTGTSSCNTWRTFTTSYVDADGASNLWMCSFLVNTSISNTGGGHFFYSENTNKLFMKNNAGAWVPASGVSLGTATTIESENAVLDCAGTTVTKGGNTLTISWRVKFKSAMAGKACNLYTRANDDYSADSGWIAKGKAAVVPSDYDSLIAQAKAKLGQVMAMEPYDATTAKTLIQQAKDLFTQAKTLQPTGSEAVFGLAVTTTALQAQALVDKYQPYLGSTPMGVPPQVKAVTSAAKCLSLWNVAQTADPETSAFTSFVADYTALAMSDEPTTAEIQDLVSAIQSDVQTVVIPLLAQVSGYLDTVEQDPSFTFQIPAPDPEDQRVIDIGDVYLFHSGLLLVKAMLALPASYNLDFGEFTFNPPWYERDLNHNGTITPSEWMPESPFGTLADPTLMYAQKSELLTACDKATAGLDATLAETADDSELIPMHGSGGAMYRLAAMAMKGVVAQLKAAIQGPTLVQIPAGSGTQNVVVYLGAWSDNPPPNLIDFVPNLALEEEPWYEGSLFGDLNVVAVSYPDTTFGGLFPEGLPDAMLQSDDFDMESHWLMEVTTSPADGATNISKSLTQFSVTWPDLQVYPVTISLEKQVGDYTWSAVSTTTGTPVGSTVTCTIGASLAANTFYRIVVDCDYWGDYYHVSYFRTGP